MGRKIHAFPTKSIRGEIRLSEPKDNPDELLIITMPFHSDLNVTELRSMTDKGWVQTNCPLCGTDCWASPLLPNGAALYPGRTIAACTDCSIKSTMNKEVLPRFLKRRGIRADELIKPILALHPSPDNQGNAFH